MNIEKHMSGFLTGVAIIGAIVLATQVIFVRDVPKNVHFEYVPQHSQDYEPKTPTNEDNGASVLPQSCSSDFLNSCKSTVIPPKNEPPKEIKPLPPVQAITPEIPPTAKPDDGQTTYFGRDNHETKLPELNSITPSELPTKTTTVPAQLKKKYLVNFTTTDMSTGLSHHHLITRTDIEYVTITFTSLSDGSPVLAQEIKN